MASAKAENRYGMHGSKFEAPEKEAGREAERTAGAKPKEPGKKVTKVGSDKGPRREPAKGRYEEGSEEMEHETHARHEHEHMAMHHRHMMEHHERHHRHAMERYHMREEESHEERKRMHDRHEKEHQHAHNRHESEKRAMHERHESELAAPGEETSERKPTDRPLSLVGGRK